jgi:recombination protein RecA
MSQALRKITGSLNKTGTAAVFINQLREKIGVMFGNPETQPGGRALKYYASVRLDTRRIETLKVGNDNVGIRVRVKVVKNKVAPPFKQAEFDILFGSGVSRSGSLIDIGAELGVIAKAGAFYSYKGERLGQGRENVRKYLDANPNILDAIDNEIRNGDAAKEALTLGSADVGDE